MHREPRLEALFRSEHPTYHISAEQVDINVGMQDYSELIGILESGEEPERLAAGAALERLLGAGVVEPIEIMPDALEDVIVVDPDPEAKPPPKTLAELVTDPRDRLSAGSSETMEVPSIDPARWRARSPLSAGDRGRRGRPDRRPATSRGGRGRRIAAASVRRARPARRV